MSDSDVFATIGASGLFSIPVIGGALWLTGPPFTWVVIGGWLVFCLALTASAYTEGDTRPVEDCDCPCTCGADGGDEP